MEKIKLSRNELVNLYTILRNLDSSTLDREVRKSYILLKVELDALFEEFEKVRTKISEETKPKLEDVKAEFKKRKKDDKKFDVETIVEGGEEYQEFWNGEFQPIILKWLSEEVDIETKIFDAQAYAEFIIANDIKDPQLESVILRYFVK